LPLDSSVTVPRGLDADAVYYLDSHAGDPRGIAPSAVGILVRIRRRLPSFAGRASDGGQRRLENAAPDQFARVAPHGRFRAQWGEAVIRGLDGEPGSFLNRYR